MTVCVSAICQHEGESMIVGASDRMVTVAPIEFEPGSSKTHVLGSGRVGVMTAGEMSLHAEALAAIREDETWKDPDKAASVPLESVATVYASRMNLARTRRATIAVLGPLGLDIDAFNRQQSQLAEGFRERRVEEIRRMILDATAIIFGFDGAAARLFVADLGGTRREDLLGFAAIGSGAGVAGSFLAVSRHTSDASFGDTLFRVFAAKKFAETVTGVGANTDVVIARASGMNLLPKDHVVQLERLFAAFQARAERAAKAAAAMIDRDVQTRKSKD